MQIAGIHSRLRGPNGRARFASPVKSLHSLRSVALALSFALCATAALAQPAGNASYVNPMIGTGTGPGSTENLLPGPSMPFGMVQLSPDTENSGFG